MAINAGTVAAYLTLDTGKFTSTLQRTGQDLKKFADSSNDMGTRIDSLGGAFNTVGTTLTKSVTVPLVGAGVVLSKFSKDFNSDMANIATLIPGQTARVNELKDGIQDLAIKTGKATSDISDGTYQVISAFGDTAETMKLTEINAKAAAAGVATTTDAINLTSAVTKGYGDTTAQAVEHAADLAFQTVKLGQTTFPELASSIGKVVPLSKQLNVSQEEMFAIFATGTGVTGTASEVATQYRGVLQALMAPTKDMSALFDRLGVKNGEAMIAQYGLKGAMDLVVNTANESGTPLQKYIGSIEGQTIALALTGAQSDVYTDKLSQMKDASGAMVTAFKEQTEGVNEAGFSWEQAKVSMVVAAQKMGDVLAPALKSISDIIIKVTDVLNNMDKGTRENIVKIGMFAAAIGPAMLIIGKLIGTVKLLVDGFNLLKTGFTIIMPVFKALWALLAANPIGLVIAAITVLVATFYTLYKHNESFRNFVNGVYASIKEGLGAAFKWITDQIAAAYNWGSNMMNMIAQGIKSRVNAVGDAVKGVASKIKSLLGFSSPTEEGPGKDSDKWAPNFVNMFAKGIDNNSYKVSNATKKIADDMKKNLDNLGDAVMTALKNRYQEEEKIQLDSLTKQTENLRRETDARLKEYDREYAAKLRLLDDGTNEELRRIQEQIEGINNKTKQEEKDLEEQEYRNRIAAKRKELYDAESAEERAKIQDELSKIIADRERKLLLESRQEQVNHLRNEMDRVREQAQKKKDALKEEYDNKKKIEDDKANAVIEALRKEMESTKQHFAQLTSAENLQAEARKMFLNKNNQDMIQLLKSYNPKWQDAGQSFGDSLLYGLNSTKRSIESAVNDMLSLVSKGNSAASKLSTPAQTTKTTTSNSTSPTSSTGSGTQTQIRGGQSVKYHDGGWISKLGSSLRRDEVPIIAQTGEYMLSRKMVSDIQNGKSGLGNQKIENNFNIEKIEVRNDNDIKLIARELYNLQQNSLRGAGVR